MYLSDNLEILKRQKVADPKVKSPAKREILQMTKLKADTDKPKRKCCG